MVVWLAFGLFVYAQMTKALPLLLTIALNRRISSACTTFQAILGLRTRFAVLDAESSIERRSTVLKNDPITRWNNPIDNTPDGHYCFGILIPRFLAIRQTMDSS